jgi:ribosomal protein S5
MNTFDKTNIEYEMLDNVCYVNGEHLVEHLKATVYLAVSEIRKMLDSGTLDEITYAIAVASIQGMVGVGMWLEEGVIDATAEDFRKMLDNPWPDMP